MLCITPRSAVAFVPDSSVSFQPQSSASTFSAANPAPTINTPAVYEPRTPTPSTLLTPQYAASPVSRTVDLGERGIVDPMSGGSSPKIKN